VSGAGTSTAPAETHPAEAANTTVDAGVRRDALRIGLYGALANNMYNLAKVFRHAGYDATYVHEPDPYPMSQPLWEDVELTIDPERLAGAQPLPDWIELQAELGWQPPSWVVGPGNGQMARREKIAHAARLAPYLNPRLYPQLREYVNFYAGAIGRLSAFDWVITTGLGVIAAYLSGTPYLYWPFGGDVTVTPWQRESVADRFIARSIRVAVRHAAAAGSHDPTINMRLRELGYRREPAWYPFVVDTDRYRPRKDEPLGEMAQDVRDRAQGRPVLLVCSRQDFEWKGSDRFMAAYARAVRGGARLFLVLTPWGDDLERSKQMLDDAGVGDSVYVLPGLPSKPLLRRLIWAADVVVDQFALGSFGTAALEAMACGRPVLMHIDETLFAQRRADHSPPPVLQAASEEEILRVLLELADGTIDAAGAGQRARDWIAEYHGPQHLAKYLPA
jgi:glycosyltransferase involved in cell wall biosynthesis